MVVCVVSICLGTARVATTLLVGAVSPTAPPPPFYGAVGFGESQNGYIHIKFDFDPSHKFLYLT